MPMRYPLLAEDDGEGSATATSPPQFDQEALAKLVADQVDKSFKEAVTNAQQSTTQQVNTNVPEKLPFQDFVDPIVGPRIANAQLQAEIAADKADFYSSDAWLADADEFLIEDDADKRKIEKAALRAEVERVFNNAVKAGKGVPRSDVLSFVIGEKLKKDRIAYQESINKRVSNREATKLEAARRQTDLSTGNVSSFDPASIHAMSTEKMLEQYGKLEF